MENTIEAVAERLLWVHEYETCLNINTVCKKYGASFLAPISADQQGYFCYPCWKAHLAQPDDQASPKPEPPAAPPLPQP